jgi:hypothetical protein
MTDADVTRKFLTQAVPVMGGDPARELVDRVLALEREPALLPLMERLGRAADRSVG